MNKHILAILLFLILFLSSCKKQSNCVVEHEIMGVDRPKKVDSPDSKSIYALEYYGIEDSVSPDGKRLRVYKDECKETPWGTVHSPVIYLYDKEGKVLSTYNTIELVSEDFWPGDIRVNYNAERNSFDMIFGLDAYGNYGAGYIDLTTYKYIRELLVLPQDEQNGVEFEQQGIPEGYIEGANLGDNL